jgi:hypothetical protein
LSKVCRNLSVTKAIVLVAGVEVAYLFVNAAGLLHGTLINVAG